MGKNLWFKKASFIWYPTSWQGWIITILWITFVVFAVLMMDHEWLKNLIFIILSTFFFVRICIKKSDRSRSIAMQNTTTNK